MEDAPIIEYKCLECGGTFLAKQGSRKRFCPECLAKAVAREK